MPNVATKRPEGLVSTRGFTAVEFICPRCQGRRWGTTAGWGHCNARSVGDCAFSWDRQFDWLYFHRRDDGRGFMSAQALEIVIGPETARVA